MIGQLNRPPVPIDSQLDYKHNHLDRVATRARAKGNNKPKTNKSRTKLQHNLKHPRLEIEFANSSKKNEYPKAKNFTWLRVRDSAMELKARQEPNAICEEMQDVREGRRQATRQEQDVREGRRRSARRLGA
ncbi:hypothetical protein NL676_002282 [Syzygium grande]|nr:hypothetical protein NL676_002282 [Syzygium grande]